MDYSDEELYAMIAILDIDDPRRAKISALITNLVDVHAKLDTIEAKLDTIVAKLVTIEANTSFLELLREIGANMDAHIKNNFTHRFSMTVSFDHSRNIPVILQKIQNIYTPDYYQVSITPSSTLKGEYNLSIY